VDQIVKTVKESVPVDHDLPGYHWTIKKLRRWVKQVLGCDVSRRILGQILKEHRLSWKKC
jgi:transposase